MDCQFDTLSIGSRCVRCGWPLPHDVEYKLHRQCDGEGARDSNERKVALGTSQPVIPCVYLGEQIRSVPVQVCNGRPILRAVYECGIHGECFPVGRSQEIAACPCPSYCE